MKNLAQHQRKSIRLKDYDYSSYGFYFITICTYNRELLFGNVVNGKMILNDLGKIVNDFWLEIPAHFSNVELDEFVIMPNHIHGIIVINPNPRSVGVTGYNGATARVAPTNTSFIVGAGLAPAQQQIAPAQLPLPNKTPLPWAILSVPINQFVLKNGVIMFIIKI